MVDLELFLIYFMVGGLLLSLVSYVRLEVIEKKEREKEKIKKLESLKSKRRVKVIKNKGIIDIKMTKDIA